MCSKLIFAKQKHPDLGCFGKTDSLFFVKVPIGSSNSKTDQSIDIHALPKINQPTHDHGSNNEPGNFCCVF
jgi:hypothetical protein